MKKKTNIQIKNEIYLHFEIIQKNVILILKYKNKKITVILFYVLFIFKRTRKTFIEHKIQS